MSFLEQEDVAPDHLAPVAERFASINGEGVRAGRLAAFVRFAGCNLACSYCDTAWANEPACDVELMSTEAIAEFVREAGVLCVTLTGGEPLLQPVVPDLVRALLGQQPRLFVEIETNGAVDVAPLARLRDEMGLRNAGRLGFTMDCKMPSSGMSAFMIEGNFAHLTRDDTVKFVVGSDEDLLAMREVVRKQRLEGRCAVYVSPVFGAMNPARIVDFVRDSRLAGTTVQLQLHKIIWPACERGV